MDIIIFSGQSNAQGATGSMPQPNEPVSGAFEYRYLTDSLQPLGHPCGEDIDGELVEAYEGFGSLPPYLCAEYVRLTGREVVAVHAARGSTTVKIWDPKGGMYAAAIKKVRAAIKKVGTPERVYLVWLQGESDAHDRMGADEYLERLTAIKNAFRADAGIDVFGIIKVGYFNYIIPHSTPRDPLETKTADETIMEAQERAAAQDRDFVMLSRLCPKLSLDKNMLNPRDPGHYNNEALELIGKDAAKTLAKL